MVPEERGVSSGSGKQAERQCANILRVRVDAVNMDLAIARVEGWIQARDQNFAVFRDAHGVMQCQEDERFLNVHRRAGMVCPDGMPIMWLTRSACGPHVSRVYGPDFMLAFCEATKGKAYRHFFYGTTEDTIDKLIARLRAISPALQVAGKMAPPFRTLSAEEDAAIVAEINATAPDIIWVGLGTPKQEYWMNDHLGAIQAPAMMGVGAAFDFLAGVKPQAPLWMQRSGLEWSFRLLTEPRRMIKRFAYRLPAFAVLSLGQKIGLLRYD